MLRPENKRELKFNSVTSGGSQLNKGGGGRAVSPSALANLRKFEVFALLGCDAAYVGRCLSTFRDILSVPSSRVKQFMDSQAVSKRR